MKRSQVLALALVGICSAAAGALVVLFLLAPTIKPVEEPRLDGGLVGIWRAPGGKSGFILMQGGFGGTFEGNMISHDVWWTTPTYHSLRVGIQDQEGIWWRDPVSYSFELNGRHLIMSSDVLIKGVREFDATVKHL